MTDPAADFSSPVRDFSRPVEPLTFTIDGETFRAPRTIAVVNMAKLAKVFTDVQANDQQWILDNLDTFLPKIGEVLQLLVPGDGGRRLAARVNADGSDPDLVPLDLAGQVMPLLVWLVERLGLRPTQPSQPSSDGSTETTTDTTPSDVISSTDGVSLTE